MGAGVFHVRVRDGIGCRHPAKATRSSSPPTWAECALVGVYRGPGACVRVVVCCGVWPACWQDTLPFAGAWMTAVQDGCCVACAALLVLSSLSGD